MTLTECKNLMRLYQGMAEDVQFNWRTTARWALRHKWAEEENAKLRHALVAARDELASMTVRMQIAEDGRQIETRRAERALDTLARYEQQQWMARAIGAEAAEERMLAEHPRRMTIEGDGRKNRGVFMVMGPERIEGSLAGRNDPCRWSYDGEYFNSECGNVCDFRRIAIVKRGKEGDAPKSSDWQFCPYCGRPIAVKV